MSNIFEVSLTEEGMGSGKYIFELGFKFSASEVRSIFYSTSSSDLGEIAEQLGVDRGVIGAQAIERYLAVYDK